MFPFFSLVLHDASLLATSNRGHGSLVGAWWFAVRGFCGLEVRVGKVGAPTAIGFSPPRIATRGRPSRWRAVEVVILSNLPEIVETRAGRYSGWARLSLFARSCCLRFCFQRRRVSGSVRWM